MELTPGKVAVVTGAASGIGLALAHRFAAAGMSIVLADIEAAALDVAAEAIAERGVPTLAVVTDVSSASSVEALAAATVERFGGVHLVCNNAGVSGLGDPWLGPLASWEWVLGVNMWGVIHGVRAFLPQLIAAGGGHIVNTASVAGLLPIGAAPYDASKHAVVALTEDLYHFVNSAMLPVGVSCLCPGWVRTRIMDSDRNWTGDPELAKRDPVAEITLSYVKRVIDEGMQPAMVADFVADAVTTDRFWVLPDKDFTELAVARWSTITEEQNPVRLQMPGMPTVEEITARVLAALGEQPPA